MGKDLINDIFETTGAGFYENALRVFQYQKQHNAVYADWIAALPETEEQGLHAFRYLPVNFFKTHRVACGDFEPQIIFTSSGTTGMETSKHFVKDVELYQTSFTKGFDFFYGAIEQYCVLALLPSYLERSGSSLIYMAEEMIRQSNQPESGFHLYDFDRLSKKIHDVLKMNRKILLLGVSFALLDFAESFPSELKAAVIVMETGGMKGRKKEMIRTEVHEILKKNLKIDAVHAEYGMTELLSQAYSKGDGRFFCPPWMKVVVRQEDDPLAVRSTGRGLINVIDLANVYSCSFIATDDIGIVYDDGSFEVLGRADNSDIRGCSLLIA